MRRPRPACASTRRGALSYVGLVAPNLLRQIRGAHRAARRAGAAVRAGGRHAGARDRQRSARVGPRRDAVDRRRDRARRHAADARADPSLRRVVRRAACGPRAHGVRPRDALRRLARRPALATSHRAVRAGGRARAGRRHVGRPRMVDARALSGGAVGRRPGRADADRPAPAAPDVRDAGRRAARRERRRDAERRAQSTGRPGSARRHAGRGARHAVRADPLAARRPGRSRSR